MEQFSLAYIAAIASVVGCAVEGEDVDIDSGDVTLLRRKPGTVVRSPRLILQVKATTQNCIGETTVSHQLEARTYTDLAAVNLQVPKILVVVALPENVETWTTHSELQLALRKCGYWLSLKGAPSIGAQQSKTVHLPRDQAFDAMALDGIFDRIENGGEP